MDSIVLSSRGSPWRRLYDTNVSAASAAFTTDGLQGRTRGPIDKDNLYSDSGDLRVLDLRAAAGPGGTTPNSVIFVPFGRDTTNQTMSMRIWGVEEGVSGVGGSPVKSWEPMLLAELLCTLSAAKAGVAGSLVESSDYYCDTISLTQGASQDIVIASNASDLRAAWARIDILGFPILVVEMDDGASATQVNSLYRFLW